MRTGTDFLNWLKRFRNAKRWTLITKVKDTEKDGKNANKRSHRKRNNSIVQTNFKRKGEWITCLI